MTGLFRVFIPAGVFTLLISDFLLTASAFVLTSYLVLEVDPTVYLFYDNGFVPILVVVFSILVGLHFQNLYSRLHVKSRIVLIQELCLVMGWAFLLQGLISYLVPDLKLPVRVMLWGGLLTLAALFTWRAFFSAFALRMLGHDRLLLVGPNSLLEDLGAHIVEHPELGLLVAGYVRDAQDGALPGGEILGPVASLREIVETTHPDRIVVGSFERRAGEPIDDLLNLRFAGYAVEEAASAYEKIRGRVCLKELRLSQLIDSGELTPRPRILLYQAILNMLLAAVAVTVSAPVMAAAALAVKLSSPGPVLDRRTRVGRNDVPFTLYRFRCTRTDAQGVPRVTGAGRLLGKLRIDELPQLFNVLKGDMSFVGPRPERPEFVAELCEYFPYYRQRHCVRPGITGWAQINAMLHGDAMDTTAGIERDLYYIKNMSLGMDTFILFHAFKSLLLGRRME
jgi:exopolysaccharide biosynthesis polyprenyl glycosylphosphotransferase